MKDIDYNIAEHIFRLSFSEEACFTSRMDNYAPFRMTGYTGRYLFHLCVAGSLSQGIGYSVIGQFEDPIASITILRSESGGFRFLIGYPNSNDYCTMDTDQSFSTAEVVLPKDPQYGFYCLNNCLMLLYAFSTAGQDTVLMHASVIKNAGKGYLFLGKSGTGKSTHSRLWLDHVEDSELLNDDNPIVRIIDGQAMVYGSPWSGKTPCYRNESLPLGGIVKLRQAPENKIKRLPPLQAYAAVLPSCSCMRWEEELMTGVHNTVEQLATGTPCYTLDCLADADAAILCSSTIKENI